MQTFSKKDKKKLAPIFKNLVEERKKERDGSTAQVITDFMLSIKKWAMTVGTSADHFTTDYSALTEYCSGMTEKVPDMPDFLCLYLTRKTQQRSEQRSEGWRHDRKRRAGGARATSAHIVRAQTPGISVRG
jgi:hypothetical protein